LEKDREIERQKDDRKTERKRDRKTSERQRTHFYPETAVGHSYGVIDVMCRFMRMEQRKWGRPLLGRRRIMKFIR
jgi:hypothetical protein